MLDASVAARFLLAEDLSDRAGAVLDAFIRGETALIAPALITYEVGNALRKAVTMGYISRGEAASRLGSFVEMGIGCLRPGRGECLRALELSAAEGMTFYDAAYIAAAEKAGAPLVTADEALYKKASQTVKAIRLKDYPGPD